MMRPSLPLAAALLSCALPACTGDSLDLSATESKLDISTFVLPSLSEAQRATIVHRYDALDPDNVVPRGLLEDTILYFDVNKASIPKQAYFAVVDQSLFSGKNRFWLVDLATGAVEAHHVAHGDGSDPDYDGFATLFSNTSGSHMSSLGFYLTGEIYDGTHPHSMKLDGLSPDGSPNGMANTNVRARAVVVHEATYVDDQNTAKNGRSNGCLALDPSVEAGIVDRIHDGSLIYAATSALNTPVGRAACGDGLCDGSETPSSCATDCDTGADDPGDVTTPSDDAPDLDAGGCSAGNTGGGTAGLLVLACIGVIRPRSRRRR